MNRCVTVDGDGKSSLDPCRVTFKSQTLDVGVLFRPPEASWRLGVGFRRGSIMTLASEVPPSVAEGGPPLPDRVQEPTRLSAGFSYMLRAHDAPYNLPITASGPWGKARRGLQSLDQDPRYLLLAVDVSYIAAVLHEPVSFESYVQRKPRRTGAGSSLTLHLGAEAEVLADLLILRLGTYTEPDRVHAENLGRLHGTGGFDLKLFKAVKRWRLGFTFDVAPRYQNLMFGVGFWPTHE